MRQNQCKATESGFHKHHYAVFCFIKFSMKLWGNYIKNASSSECSIAMLTFIAVLRQVKFEVMNNSVAVHLGGQYSKSILTIKILKIKILHNQGISWLCHFQS